MKKNLLFSLTLALLAVFATTASATTAKAAECSSAQKYIESLSNDVVGVIKSGAADKAKEAQLTTIFKHAIDSDWMGKFVLGRNWKALTPEQQKTYLGKYSNFLIASYVPIFRKYSGEKINVVSSSPLEKEGEFTVNTNIERAGKEAVLVNYRVRKDASCFKVTDFIAEGISLINTQRQDFGAVFSSKGYDGLSASLDSKIAAAAVAAK